MWIALLGVAACVLPVVAAVGYVGTRVLGELRGLRAETAALQGILSSLTDAARTVAHEARVAREREARKLSADECEAALVKLNEGLAYYAKLEDGASSEEDKAMALTVSTGLSLLGLAPPHKEAPSSRIKREIACVEEIVRRYHTGHPGKNPGAGGRTQ